MFSLICFWNMKVKIEVDYPAVNVLISQEINHEEHDVETKRVQDDRVFANINRKELYSDRIRINFVCGVNTEFYINNIRVSLGNYVIKNISDLVKTNIDVHDINIERHGTENVLITTGENPYIVVKDITQNLRWYKMIYVLRTFVLCLSVSLLISYLLVAVKKEVNVKCLNNAKYDIKRTDIIYIAVVTAIMVIHLLVKQGSQVTGMFKVSELLAAYIVILCITWQIKKRSNNFFITILLTLIVSVFVLLSIYKLTGYLMVDEYQHIIDTYRINEDKMFHWYANCSHASYVIKGTWWKIIPESLITGGYIMFEQLGKLFHWTLALLLICTICDESDKYLFDEKNTKWKAVRFACLVITFLSMPDAINVYKAYTYTMLALLLGIFGIVETLIFLRTQHKGKAILACILFILALSEKMIVLPAAVICWGIILCETVRDKENKIFHYVKNTLLLCCGIFVIFLLEQRYVFEILREHGPINTWKDALITICSLPYVGAGAILKEIGFEAESNLSFYLSGVLMVLGIIGVSVIYALIRKYRYKFKTKIVANCIGISGIAYVILGVFASIVGEYNYKEFRLDYFMAFCSSYINAIPTIFVVLSLIIFARLIRRDDEISSYSIVYPVCSYCVAFCYTIIHNTNFVGSAYYNIYILLYMFITIVLFWEWLDRWTVEEWKCITGVMCTGLFVAGEIASSEPAFSDFIPIWNVKLLYQNEYGVPMYWGEERLIAGEKIKAYCENNSIDLSEVVMYVGYPAGSWLDRGEISEGNGDWKYNSEAASTKETDFYVFETNGIELNWFGDQKVPDETIQPIMTLTYRGRITARIYQGSDLIEYFKGEQ